MAGEEKDLLEQIADNSPISRRDVLKIGVAVFGSLALFGVVPPPSSSKDQDPSTAQAGGPNRAGVETGQAGVTVVETVISEEKIEEIILDPQAIEGANAIFRDKDGLKAVRIPAQIPNDSRVKIRLHEGEVEVEKETNPAELIFPSRPLENWWPGDNLKLPDDHTILKTIRESQVGIDRINELYRACGVRNTAVRSVDEVGINLEADGSAYDQVYFADGRWTQDVPVPRFATSVRGPNGAVLEMNEQTYNYRDFSEPIPWSRLLSRTIHEHVHTSTAGFGYVEKYYVGDSGNPPSQALELFTDAMTAMAIQEVILPSVKNEERKKALNSMVNVQAIPWLEKVAEDLDKKGLKGMDLVVQHGAMGDMLNLQKIYDSQYDAGAFAKIPDQIRPQ